MQQRRAKILGRAEKERERERERVSNVLEWAKLRTMKRANENACNMQRERKRNFLSKNIFLFCCKSGCAVAEVKFAKLAARGFAKFYRKLFFLLRPLFSHFVHPHSGEWQLFKIQRCFSFSDKTKESRLPLVL